MFCFLTTLHLVVQMPGSIIAFGGLQNNTVHLGLPGGSIVKNPSANAGDMNSIPGSGGFPGE